MVIFFGGDRSPGANIHGEGQMSGHGFSWLRKDTISTRAKGYTVADFSTSFLSILFPIFFFFFTGYLKTNSYKLTQILRVCGPRALFSCTNYVTDIILESTLSYHILQ